MLPRLLDNILFEINMFINYLLISENIVLRIPVLYGPVSNLNESAVTTLLNTLLKSDVPSAISHIEKRCPSHVDDIAYICWQLACAQQKVSYVWEYWSYCILREQQAL